jgi:predicted RNase H-like HicB family nuclease
MPLSGHLIGWGRETVPNRSSQKTLFVLIIIERDGKKYHGFAPGLKGLHVDGRTVDATAKNAMKAVCAYLISLERRGESIPLGPYLKADYIRIDKEIVPDLPGMAFLQSIPCPSQLTSGVN